MAGKLKSEDLALNIIVNGNKAQSEIGQLGRSMQDTKAKVKDLEAEQRRLEKQGQKNSQRYKDLTKQIQQHNSILDYSRKRLDQLNQSLSLEDKTIKQLNDTLRQLKRLRDQTVPGTDQYNAYNDQIAEVSARLSYLRGEADRTGNALTRMGGGLKRFFSSTLGGIASVTALAMGVARARDEYARFDDKIADVMKTTNASKESVRELNEELEKIDTRTSQDDLLGLGRIGGKLGITDMDELRGFVEATNQVVVALNEDLGGDVESTVSAVGKLVDIFGVKEVFGMEQGLLKVGSAINELGMASTANEGYMVEFSRRMAGVAPLANISVQEILGLGATLDQLGQTAEVSSTALSKLFLKLASEAESFAKYAGMEVAAFKDLLEKDFMAAFTAVLNGVRDNANGINELASTLGDLDLDGGRVIGVLGSLANNTQILTDQINLANDAFEKGTSLTEEYTIKNTTAQAQLEKKRKEVTRLWRELGERLWPAISAGNSLLIILARTLSTIIGFIADNIRIITVLTIAITAYTVAVNAARVGTIALAAGQRIATAVQWAWNAALAANPIGLIVAGIAAATTAIALYTRRLNESEFAQKSLNDTIRDAEKEVVAEVKSIQRLQSVLNDNTRSLMEKEAAVRQLRDIIPDVLQQYSDEEVLAGRATEAIERHVQALRKQARVRAAQQKIDELEREKLDIQSGDRGWTTNLYRSARARLLGAGTGAVLNAKEDVQDIRNIDAAIDALVENILEANTELNTLVSTAIGEPDEPLTAFHGSTRKTAEETAAERQRKEQEKILEDQKRFREQVLFNAKSAIDQEAAMHQDRLNQAGLAGLEEINLTAEQKEVLRLLNEQHQNNLKNIDAKAIEDGLKQKEDAFNRELTALRMRNNEELLQADTLEKAKIALARTMDEEQLAQIKTMSQARKALEEQHNQEERQMAAEQTRALMAIIQQIIDTNEFEGVDLANEILSDEQKDALVDRLQITKEKLQELLKLMGLIKDEDPMGDAEKKRYEDSTDILGMSISDWKQLFDNIKQGKIGIDELMNVWGLASQAWNKYNAFVAAGEKRRLQEYEEQNNRQKEVLDKRLKAGTISQEQYNAQIEKLDKEMAKKRARMEHDQAKRERSAALMSAIVSTAAGVARAFKDFAFPMSAIIAGIVGGLGALQIGTIARAPLPSLAGREDGGFLVRRSQDGKVFNASHDPDRRGYVGKPTVIVGENGNEFVANADAVANPSVRPILDVIDTAQRNGTISTLQLENILPRARDLRASIPGRQDGGSLTDHSSVAASQPLVGENGELKQLVRRNTEVMQGLKDEIRKGIKAEVALLGKNGFYEKDEEYRNIQSGANL